MKEFIKKFAIVILIACIAVNVLSLFLSIIAGTWKFLLGAFIIYGIYLVVTGKYKEFAVKLDSLWSDIIGIVKH